MATGLCPLPLSLLPLPGSNGPGAMVFILAIRDMALNGFGEGDRGMSGEYGAREAYKPLVCDGDGIVGESGALWLFLTVGNSEKAML